MRKAMLATLILSAVLSVQGAYEFSAITNSTAGSKVTSIVPDGYDIATLQNIYTVVQQIAPEWVKPASGETGTAYTAGSSLCTYEDVLYQCKRGYTTESNSNPPPDDIYDATTAPNNHWEAKKVSELFLPLTGGTLKPGVLTLEDSTDYKRVLRCNGTSGDFYIDTYDSSGTHLGSIFVPTRSGVNTIAFTSDIPSGSEVFLPLVTDSQGNKTAITVGSRASGSTVGEYSVADGSNTTASGNYSHAEGITTTASGNYSHAEGSYTTASGNYSHAEGSTTTANGYYSHAEGLSTTASYSYSHAEGGYTTAIGHCSHAEGYYTTASASYSHAEGGYTTASGYCSHAEGYRAVTAESGSGTSVGNPHRVAFAWQGQSGTTTRDYYHSHGDGTFNINPIPASGETDVASGFYIGEQSLKTRLDTKVNKTGDEEIAGHKTFTGAMTVEGEFVVQTNGIVTVQTWDQIRLASGQTLPEYIAAALSASPSENQE